MGQTIRDRALSNACALVSSTDSAIAVDIPSEMKKLHPPEIANTLITSRDSWSFLLLQSKPSSEFPPESIAGPSGWRSSHLKGLLKTKSRRAFLAALAVFCTRIANGSFSDECMSAITAARLVPLASPLRYSPFCSVRYISTTGWEIAGFRCCKSHRSSETGANWSGGRQRC